MDLFLLNEYEHMCYKPILKQMSLFACTSLALVGLTPLSPTTETERERERVYVCDCVLRPWSLNGGRENGSKFFLVSSPSPLHHLFKVQCLFSLGHHHPFFILSSSRSLLRRHLIPIHL